MSENTTNNQETINNDNEANSISGKQHSSPLKPSKFTILASGGPSISILRAAIKTLCEEDISKIK